MVHHLKGLFFEIQKKKKFIIFYFYIFFVIYVFLLFDSFVGLCPNGAICVLMVDFVKSRFDLLA